ncbi:hypothetical protein K2Y11_09680 [bacterium]|nr:hypothetical protein [bacterium]
MNTNPSINPFFAARIKRFAATPMNTSPKAVYAKLPLAPVNASPVPHLTSLYHNAKAGEYGSRAYPGNCGGNLIKDLLQYFRPSLVCDPMAGSGTCRDVCEELQIPCFSWDIHEGFDACDPNDFDMKEAFEFIWAHPAYWRQKLYADDSRDLSRSPTLEDFLRRYGRFIRNAAKALKANGKLAILMGDYCDREEGFVPLTYHTKRLAFECGLQQACTDIIRFSHGASSSRKVYRSSFIPGLHDTCMVFEKRARE